MKHNVTAQPAEQAPISRLKHHPDNPRLGDINAIAQSLEHHGQYKPLVVQKTTNRVLAGNHTLKAAKKLGWTQIQICYVDCDDTTALRILLADNRLNDLSDYDQIALKALLDSLPDLEGTGFSTSDLAELDSLINDPFESSEPPAKRPNPDLDPEVKVGGWQFTVSKLAYQAWDEQLKGETEGNKTEYKNTVRARIGIPEPQKDTDSPKATPPSKDTSTSLEPLGVVYGHPDNPRQGDIGAITESLKQFGQYRPIVANRRTSHILAGNHTHQAAQALGWTHIAITWVDIDETEETKLLLADNRTSDLATYNQEELTRILTQTPNLNGTGFTPDDIQEMLENTTGKPMPLGKTTIKVGKHTQRVDNQQIANITPPITSWQDLAQRLQFPLEACGGRFNPHVDFNA